ncbi:hypothetical protein [Helicobacter felis]|uniref:hypothetical protein n=1 Tax=Helicobacter felis TaxID=214 RepID=UPI001F428171|nr:hypothetical protein [Helicobacter felis]
MENQKGSSTAKRLCAMVSYGVPSCMGRYDLHGLEARVAFEMRFWFLLGLAL